MVLLRSLAAGERDTADSLLIKVSVPLPRDDPQQIGGFAVYLGKNPFHRPRQQSS